MPREWADVRAMFQLDPEIIHMAGMLLSSHPTPVREAIARHRRELDLNPPLAWQEGFNKGEESARAAAARYVGGRAQDIALTDSTTMGLALIYNGIAIRPDQEFLHTAHDHSATIQSIRHRASKTGQSVRSIRLYETARHSSADEIVTNFRAALGDRTRVAAVTWVHSATGVMLPLSQMAEVVREANAGRAADDQILFCVDGVHGFGVENIDIGAFGCDFFSAGAHKWLFGPRGTGIMWGRPQVQDLVTPTVPTFSGRSNWGRLNTPGGFHSFEHRWALAEAFELHEEVGKQRIRDRTHDLARLVKEGLEKMPNVTLHTPQSDDLSSGIVCFDVAGYSPNGVVGALRSRGIVASSTPYTPSYARLSPCVFNSTREVEQTLAAIRDL
jgi:isopenicillin-N epimerase